MFCTVIIRLSCCYCSSLLACLPQKSPIERKESAPETNRINRTNSRKPCFAEIRAVPVEATPICGTWTMSCWYSHALSTGSTMTNRTQRSRAEMMTAALVLPDVLARASITRKKISTATKPVLSTRDAVGIARISPRPVMPAHSGFAATMQFHFFASDLIFL